VRCSNNNYFDHSRWACRTIQSVAHRFESLSHPADAMITTRYALSSGGSTSLPLNLLACYDGLASSP
jgi:hypothetical protein